MAHTFVKITEEQATAIGAFNCDDRQWCNAFAAPLTDGTYAVNVLQIPQILSVKGIDLTQLPTYTQEQIEALIPPSEY